jgi:hypothetical protein
MNANNNPFGEPIFSYSRAQAISDGVLVDLTRFEITRLSWKMHLACTDSVWSLIETAVNEDGKDIGGILHDINFMARLAVMNGKQTSLVTFTVKIGHKNTNLKLHCGQGDDLNPVLTLMLSTED